MSDEPFVNPARLVIAEEDGAGVEINPVLLMGGGEDLAGLEDDEDERHGSNAQVMRSTPC